MACQTSRCRRLRLFVSTKSFIPFFCKGEDEGFCLYFIVTFIDIKRFLYILQAHTYVFYYKNYFVIHLQVLILSVASLNYLSAIIGTIAVKLKDETTVVSTLSSFSQLLSQ